MRVRGRKGVRGKVEEREKEREGRRRERDRESEKIMSGIRARVCVCA